MAISTAISCLRYSVFISVAVILPPRQQLCRPQTDVWAVHGMAAQGGKRQGDGRHVIWIHRFPFRLALQGQRNFPRCRHEKSPEALCLRLHCCPGEMGSCRHTMDSEHLHEGQMVALPDPIFNVSYGWVKRFGGLVVYNSPMGVRRELCSHISQHMVKSQSELEISHSWRLGHNALRL